MEQVDKEEPKKTYQTPEMVVYGDIRVITQTKTSGGMTADGGGPPLNKT